MFNYDFMRQAFLVGGMIALVIPIVGLINVLQHRSLVGDALSHVSLSGILIGLIMGINPLWGAIILSIFAAVSIEYIQNKLGRYQDVAVAIILSTGVGMAGILMRFVPNATNLNNYLFGSLVAIDSLDNIIAIILTIIILLIICLLYRKILYVTFSKETAYLSGIKTNYIQLIIAIITAITVAITSRIVGALVVSSLMVIPCATALQLKVNFKKTILFGMLLSFIDVWIGLTISYYMNFMPGGTIVITSVLVFLIVIIGQKIIVLRKKA